MWTGQVNKLTINGHDFYVVLNSVRIRIDFDHGRVVEGIVEDGCVMLPGMSPRYLVPGEIRKWYIKDRLVVEGGTINMSDPWYIKEVIPPPGLKED